MARRLIVDTGVFVATERGLAPEVRDDDVAIAAITLAELGAGVHLASDAHRPARAAYVERIAMNVPVIPYGHEVAETHAKLLAHARRSGRPRGAHDLIIAATALATGRTLLTGNRAARFDELPGLDVLLLG